jgi:hypothetical protein
MTGGPLIAVAAWLWCYYGVICFLVACSALQLALEGLPTGG